MKKKITFWVVPFLFLIVLTGCQSISKKVDMIKELIESGETEEALEVYESTMSDDHFSREDQKELDAELTPFLLENIKKLSDEYIKKEVEYKEVTSTFTFFKEMKITEVDELVSEKENQLETIKQSRDSLAEGLKAMEYNQYLEAITHLSTVDQNTEEYKTAQDQLNLAKAEIIKNADKHSREGNLLEAINTLSELQLVFTSDTEIKTKIEAYETDFINENIAEADQLVEEQRFDEAYSILDYISGIVGAKPVLDEKWNEYVLAEDLFYQQQLDSLLSLTTQYYDEFKDVTILAPIGHSVQYVDIYMYETSFYPRLYLTDTAVDMEMVVGFGQDDWLFFESIDFNVDGELFTWEANYFDKQTEVDYGVYEWIVLDTYNQPNIVEHLEKIANSNTAKLRFQGEGFRDYTITETDKEKIRVFLALYEYFLAARI